MPIEHTGSIEHKGSTFYDLSYDTIILIAEFLEDAYSYADTDTINFIKSSRHVPECLNQIKRHDLVRINGIAPCLIPYNYFSLHIYECNSVDYIKYVKANYPKLKLSFTDYNADKYDDFDYVSSGSEYIIPPHKYLTYKPNITELTELTELKEGDILPRIRLTDKSNITIKHYSIHILNLKKCTNIKIISKHIEQIYLCECSNINWSGVDHIYHIDRYL